MPAPRDYSAFAHHDATGLVLVGGKNADGYLNLDLRTHDGIFFEVVVAGGRGSGIAGFEVDIYNVETQQWKSSSETAIGIL